MGVERQALSKGESDYRRLKLVDQDKSTVLQLPWELSTRHGAAKVK